MPTPLELLSKVAPLAARHFAAYLDLFADEATELGTHVSRRVAAIIAALMAIAFALAMACVWILTAVWDTPWRQFTIIGLFLVFTVAAVVAWQMAVRRAEPTWSPFQRLRSEWALDHQLILDLVEPDAPEPEATAPSRSAKAAQSAQPARPVAEVTS